VLSDRTKAPALQTLNGIHSDPAAGIMMTISPVPFKEFGGGLKKI
jgi:hypothetical protein